MDARVERHAGEMEARLDRLTHQHESTTADIIRRQNEMGAKFEQNQDQIVEQLDQVLRHQQRSNSSYSVPGMHHSIFH